MENQHRKITGYRELSQNEIDLMNKIKEKGEELGQLITLIQAMNSVTSMKLQSESGRPATGQQFDRHLYDSVIASNIDSVRWIEIGKDHLQQGIMALVRAIARPTSF